MKKCIDRDKFMQNLEALNYGYTDCIKVGLALDGATVDAEEVKHGVWIQNVNFCFCSECHTMGSTQWKRCPICEAKMDGKRGEKDVGRTI